MALSSTTASSWKPTGTKLFLPTETNSSNEQSVPAQKKGPVIVIGGNDSDSELNGTPKLMRSRPTSIDAEFSPALARPLYTSRSQIVTDFRPITPNDNDEFWPSPAPSLTSAVIDDNRLKVLKYNVQPVTRRQQGRTMMSHGCDSPTPLSSSTRELYREEMNITQF